MSFTALLLAEGAETNPLASIGFAAGCLLLIFFLLRRSYIRFGRRTRGGDGPPIVKQRRPEHAWDGAKQDADARLGRQEVEFHEMARDVMGRLDSKMRLLQALIAQSDERIAQLEALNEGISKTPKASGDSASARTSEG